MTNTLHKTTPQRAPMRALQLWITNVVPLVCTPRRLNFCKSATPAAPSARCLTWGSDPGAGPAAGPGAGPATTRATMSVTCGATHFPATRRAVQDLSNCSNPAGKEKKRRHWTCIYEDHREDTERFLVSSFHDRHRLLAWGGRGGPYPRRGLAVCSASPAMGPWPTWPTRLWTAAWQGPSGCNSSMRHGWLRPMPNSCYQPRSGKSNTTLHSQSHPV